jgi:hypothetical protein
MTLRPHMTLTPYDMTLESFCPSTIWVQGCSEALLDLAHGHSLLSWEVFAVRCEVKK